MDAQDYSEIARRVVEQLRPSEGFHIDEEIHYQDHLKMRHLDIDAIRDISEAAKLIGDAKSYAFRLFLGLTMVGLLASILIALLYGKPILALLGKLNV